MRIGGRLLLLLAIPLVALLCITGYGVYHGATRASEASRLKERTELGMLAHSLIADLQAERAALLSGGSADPQLRESIVRTHDAIRSRAASVGGGIEQAAGKASVRLAGVDHVANASLGGRVALNSYSTAIAELLNLASSAADPRGAIDDASASTVDYLARARAASAEEHDLLQLFSRGEPLDASGFQQLTALASAQGRYAELAQSSSSAAPDLAIRIERVGHAMRAADVIRRDAFGAFGSGRDQEWRDGLVERTEELGRLQADAAGIAERAVQDLESSSRVLLLSAFLSAVAILLVSAYLLRRAIRTIARPLQDLAAQAEDVARSRLPEAVRTQQEHGGEELHLPALRATGAAEVHEVAAAFNDIQDTALRLAGEQAALRLNQAEAMTNLGRRNQTLLARQLDFISSLETRETDPAFLEHLFKLDHLASRMRRNAESLLILAGSETPRRRRTPAPVTEVVRAAMSEVEEFERVRIGHLRDATVTGPAVIDLVHLLAELIENALGFSPPESTVEIDGRSLGQGGYQFAVIDRGVGMTDLELLAANQRMSGDDELEGMPTRYLGQYVVAKLAKKIGAMVRLQVSAGGKGVTATVNLPATAMMGGPDRSSVARPMPGSRAAREQGPAPFAPGAGVPESARAVVIDEAPADAPLWDSPLPAPAESTGSFDADSFDTPSFDTPSFDTTAFDAPSFDSAAFDAASFDAGEPFEPASFDSGSFDAAEPFDAGSSFDPAASFDPAPFDAVAPFDPAPFDGGTSLGDEPVGRVQFPEDLGDELSGSDDWAPSEPPYLEAPSVEVEPTSFDPPAPPPVPVDFPAQTDWRPDDVEPAREPVAPPAAEVSSEGATAYFGDRSPEVPSPATEIWSTEAWATDAWSTDDPAAETSTAGVFAAEASAADASTADASTAHDPAGAPAPLPSRGGLTRRVPGASLAERNASAMASTAAPAAERSATGVKSMLSSFQAGRDRGRGGAVPASGVPAGDQTPTDGLNGPEDSDEWRSLT